MAQNPYDNLKDTALKSDVLGEEIDYELINPFSRFFDPNLAREVVTQAYKGEFDRQNGISSTIYQRAKERAAEDYNRQKTNLAEDDASYRTKEAKNFERTLSANDQNYANSGAFFGGAREGQRDLISEDRQADLNDYARRFAAAVSGLDMSQGRFLEDLDFNKGNEDFDRERQQNRIVDSEVQNMEDEKRAMYEDEKQRYYDNPEYKSSQGQAGATGTAPISPNPWGSGSTGGKTQALHTGGQVIMHQAPPREGVQPKRNVTQDVGLTRGKSNGRSLN